MNSKHKVDFKDVTSTATIELDLMGEELQSELELEVTNYHYENEEFAGRHYEVVVVDKVRVIKVNGYTEPKVLKGGQYIIDQMIARKEIEFDVQYAS